MPEDDASLDRLSRGLLGKLRRMRDLEQQKRATARSTDEFHDLAKDVEREAHDVWRTAVDQEMAGREDSPLPAERAEQEPGDWTHKRDN